MEGFGKVALFVVVVAVALFAVNQGLSIREKIDPDQGRLSAPIVGNGDGLEGASARGSRADTGSERSVGIGSQTSPASPPNDGCGPASSLDFEGASAAVTVPIGQLFVVDFYPQEGGQERVTVLPEGTWQPHGGLGVGAAWSYADCSASMVRAQAESHARARGSTVVDPSVGFR